MWERIAIGFLVVQACCLVVTFVALFCTARGDKELKRELREMGEKRRESL